MPRVKKKLKSFARSGGWIFLLYDRRREIIIITAKAARSARKRFLFVGAVVAKRYSVVKKFVGSCINPIQNAKFKDQNDEVVPSLRGI